MLCLRRMERNTKLLPHGASPTSTHIFTLGHIKCSLIHSDNTCLPTYRLRATSHTRLRARDHHTSSPLFGGKRRAALSSLHTTLEGPTEYVSGCKMDVKSTWHSYMASNGPCCMVTYYYIFKNHLLEVGRTPNQEIMALQTLTTVDLFYFNMCEGGPA